MFDKFARQQLDDIMYEGLFDIAHMPLPDDREATKNEMIDAILAIFKGLPAMREEELTAFEADGHGYYKVTRNELRRRILAELEGE